jgi:methyltransferase OMS1
VVYLWFTCGLLVVYLVYLWFTWFTWFINLQLSSLVGIEMRVKISHLVIGTTAWIAGASTLAYRYMSPATSEKTSSSTRNPHSHHSHSVPTHDWREQAKEVTSWRTNEASAVSAASRQEIFDQGAFSYDNEIGTDELVMGLLLMRRFLLRNAKGKVLETAAGSGRNIKYYPSKCAVTMIDSSPKMLAIAAKKVKDLNGDQRKKFCCYTTSNDSTLPFDDRSFDTVVDTFGLCSYEDPVEGLKEMSRVLKPGGSMLLLEHGRSHYEFLNTILDNSAYKHAKRWGCWFNRDMDTIFEEAGLNIRTQYRFHFGTTWYVIVNKE